MAYDTRYRVQRRTVLRATGGSVLGALALTSSSRAGHDEFEFEFGRMTYVDTDRAGGEPTITTHPDGTLLYSAHAGTTHFFAPAAADPDTSAFLENYEGQAYYWWSDDLGATWHFAGRSVPPDGVPNSGFSDPEFAIDQAGNVYISEINLVNVAVSKSYDSGHTYELQNFFGQVMEDRQWMTADEDNVLYMTGNVFAGGTFPNDPVGNTGRHLWKSTDGGETFVDAKNNTNGEGEIHVDKATGTLYEAHLADDGTFSMSAYRGARADDFTRELNPIAENVSLASGFVSYDTDPESNVYVTWHDAGGDERPNGIYVSVSSDEGRTWCDPIRVDQDERTTIWPWLAVGDEGRVALAWLRASKALPNDDPETQGDHAWRVVAAGSVNALADDPDVFHTVATPKPIHRGTICNSGTVCQAQGVDRRLGDFFTLDIDTTGRVFVGYPDTRQGGAVCLPGFVRQTDGPRFVEQDRRRVPPGLEGDPH